MHVQCIDVDVDSLARDPKHPSLVYAVIIVLVFVVVVLVVVIRIDDFDDRFGV